MAVFTKLIADMSAYWYIVIPEILYAVFTGFCFFGPGGIAGLVLYLAAFYFFPIPAMASVGVVMAVHLILIAGKAFLGDRIAPHKKPDEDASYKGVPKRID